MKRATRHLLFAAGWVSLLVGVIGLVLPVMPTVPFLLLAAWLFLRSSERWHRWLVEHPLFGPQLTDYLNGCGVRPRTKVLAIGSMWAGVVFSILVFVPVLAIEVVMLVVAAGVTVYLVRLPSCTDSRRDRLRESEAAIHLESCSQDHTRPPGPGGRPA